MRGSVVALVREAVTTKTTYRVRIVSTEEEDTLKRVDLLNSAMFRVLSTSRLCRVESSDYRRGEISLLVYGSPSDPMFVPGKVEITVEEA